MDHLPTPHQRCLGSISVPFLAVDQYSSPLYDYPKRSGWDVNFDGDASPKLRHSANSRASRNLGSLMQTWLYFGLLTEFLGKTVDMKLFKRVEQGGAVLTSERLEELVCAKTSAMAEQFDEYSPTAVASWRDSFDKVLLLVRRNTMYLATEITKKDDEILLTCLAISVLAEYLMGATNSVCKKVGVATPVVQKFRLSNLDWPCDCGSPILKQMRQRGWCPHDIELLNVAHFKKVSTLWYLANLPTPKADFSHNACNSEECKPLHIDRDTYVQAHVENDCDCVAIGPDQAELAAIVNAGRIPLVVLDGRRVLVSEHEEGSVFVTISHVWADGKGNPHENSLPLCTMREIQQLVNELPKSGSTSQVPFWIDTLCIPRFPMKLREKALLSMREPYEQALHILVLDSYLRQQSVSDVSPFEILGLIAVCGWSQRLWTFQEGRIPRLPSRTWFAFKDKSIDLLKECKLPRPFIPTVASHTVNFELFINHNQTQMLRTEGVGFDDDYLHSVEFLRRSLRTRATTRGEDEALCLGGGILRLPKPYMEEILGIKDGNERMAKIWAKITSIRVGVAFSKAPKKLNIKGFRWAPATFMGSLNLSDRDWEGPNGCSTAPPPFISPSGLVITRPAFVLEFGETSCHRTMMRILDPEKAPSGRIAAALYDGDGRWFNCIVEEMWHDTPVGIDPDAQLVVILEGGIDFEDPKGLSYRATNKFSCWGSQKGLLATSRSSINDAHDVQTTVHRHVSIVRVSKAQDELKNNLKRHADAISAEHPDAINKNRQDDQALKSLVRGYIEDKLQKDTETLELMKEINIYDGWGDSATLAFDDCIGMIKSMVQYGSCCKISRSEDGIKWCVD